MCQKQLRTFAVEECDVACIAHVASPPKNVSTHKGVFLVPSATQPAGCPHTHTHAQKHTQSAKR